MASARLELGGGHDKQPSGCREDSRRPELVGWYAGSLGAGGSRSEWAVWAWAEDGL